MGAENFALTGIRFPDRPARLSYSGPAYVSAFSIKKNREALFVASKETGVEQNAEKIAVSG